MASNDNDEVVKRTCNVENQSNAPDIEESNVSTHENELDRFDMTDDENEDFDKTHTSNASVLDEGSFFLVGRSSRFGRSVKINPKLFS